MGVKFAECSDPSEKTSYFPSQSESKFQKQKEIFSVLERVPGELERRLGCGKAFILLRDSNGDEVK